MWVTEAEMGNAQEVIEEYEQRTSDIRQVDIVKTETPNVKSTIAMILDHEYSDDGKVKYLCQAEDG